MKKNLDKDITADNKLFRLECDNDIRRREIVELKKTLGGMIDVAEELNYRIREGRTSEGFHGVIDNAKKYTEDYYKGEVEEEEDYNEIFYSGNSEYHGRLL